MKKLYSFLIATSIGLVCHAAAIDVAKCDGGVWNPTTSYEISDGNWKAKDYDSQQTFSTAGSNWKLSGYDNRFQFYGGGVEWEATNSWLTSPEFQMKKGAKYTIAFQYRTANTTTEIPLKWWFNPIDPTSSKANATALAKVKEGCGSKTINKTTAYTEVSWEYEATENGSAYISLQVYSDGMGDALSGYVYIAGFKVSEEGGEQGPAQAAAPTSLTATANADGELVVDLAWTLPTTDAEGNDLQDVENVVVYRDETLAATLAADATEWQDTAESGLTPGEHTYTVAVTAGGQEGLLSEAVTCAYVGPFTFAPTGITEADGWTIYNAQSPNFTFSTNTAQNPSGSTGSVTMWNYAETTCNAWLSSPQLPLSAEKSYRLKFQYQTWSSMQVEHFDIYLSDVAASAATAAEIAELTPIKSTSITGTKNEWFEMEVDGFKGTGKYLVFHVSGKYSGRVSIALIELSEDHSEVFEPAAPTALTATAAEGNALEVTLTWKNPTTSVSGKPFGEGVGVEAVLVYRDSELIKELEGNVETFTDTEETGLTAGAHVYYVIAIVAETESAPSDEAGVKNVGPQAPRDCPWESAFYTDRDEFTDLWHSHTGEGHSTLLGKFYHHNAGQIAFVNANGYSENAWLVTPSFELIDGHEYTIEFDATDSNSEGTTLSLGIVSEPTATEFERVISQELNFASSRSEKTTVKFTYQANAEAQKAAQELSADEEEAAEPQEPETPENPEQPTPVAVGHFAINSFGQGQAHSTFIYGVKVSHEPDTSGVESVITDSVATDVYNLQGHRLGADAQNLPAGIYIVKSGNKTVKIRK